MENAAPLIEVGSGIGEGASATEAGISAARTATSAIRRHAISAVLVYASVFHDLDAVLQGVHAVVGSVPVLGVTTAGELHNGICGHSVVVVALASPHLRVSAAVGQHVSSGWQAALDAAISSPGVQSIIDAPADVSRERTRRGSRLFAMLFAPGNTRRAGSEAYEMLEAFKSRTLGRIPIFAGSAADDWRMEGNAVLLGSQAYPDGLLLAIFETELSYGIALGHGFRPTADHMRVTAADGREVLSLDGQPAAEVLAAKLGSSAQELTANHITLTTGRVLGTADPMGQYSVNVAAFLTPRSGVRMTQPVATGSELTVLEPVAESMIAAGGDALRKALLRASTSRPAAILCHYCALRPRIMGNENAAREVAEMVRIAGGAPLAGFCSFGEGGLSDDGVSRHNGVSVAVLVLGTELSEQAQVARENERLQREIAERAEIRLLGEALQQTEEAFVVLDSRLRFRYVNPAFTRLFAYGADEIIGKPIDLLAPDGKEVTIGHADITRQVSTDRFFHGEVRRLAKDGRIVPVLLNLAPLRDEAHEISGYIGAYTDITERKAAEAKLRESESRFRETFDNAPIGMAIIEVDGGWIRDANQAFCNFLGYPIETLKKMSLEQISHPEDMQPSIDGIRGIAEGLAASYAVEKRYLRKDGRFVWGHATASLVRSDDNVPRYLIVQIENIDDRRLAEAALHDAKERLSLAMEASQLSIWDFDTATGTVSLDGHWADMIGSSPDLTFTTAEALARDIHPTDVDLVLTAVQSCLKGTAPRLQQEFRFRTAAGNWMWIRCAGKVVERDAEGRALRVIGTNLDITDRKAAEEQIRQMAFYDRLTGLPNRRLLEDRFQQLTARIQRDRSRMSMLFIDLDKFKPINDEMGHDVGDWLLQSIAERMRGSLRESDTVARIGGDEFVVLLADIGSSGAALLAAEKIHRTLRQPFVTAAGASIAISSSIGVVLYPDHADNLRDMLRLGDQAMYRAKKGGVNAVELAA